MYFKVCYELFVQPDALLHQKGVPECSADELSMDCHPPCDYKMLRFSDGSFFCQIAYPSHTHKKLYVPLQVTSKQTIS